MTKRFKKPNPTIETSLILRFGLEFIGLAEAKPSPEKLFDAFVRAYGLIQKGYYFYDVHHDFREPTPDEIEFLADAITPYKEDPEVHVYLQETLERLREMVYVATVGPSKNPVSLSNWIEKSVPKVIFGRGFWGGPGKTNWSGNKKYYWMGNPDYSDSQQNMLGLFGLFRCDFVETLGLSLHAYASPYEIPLKPVIAPKKRSKNLGFARKKRCWSNGEFFFAACPNCGNVFFKGKCWDRTYCSSECATYYTRQYARRQKIVSLLLTHLWYVEGHAKVTS